MISYKTFKVAIADLLLQTDNMKSNNLTPVVTDRGFAILPESEVNDMMIPLTGIDGSSDLENKHLYLRYITRLSMEGRITPKAYDTELQNVMTAPTHTSINEIRASAAKSLEATLGSPARLASLLCRPQLVQYGLHNAVAIRHQLPHATVILSARECAQMGLKLRGEQTPSYIYAVRVQNTFLRDGVRWPVSVATPEEQEQILRGKLATETKNIMTAAQVYDISQLDIGPEQTQIILHEKLPAYSYQQLTELATAIRLPDGRALRVVEQPMPAMTMAGYYELVDAAIHISDAAPESQKATALLDSLAAALVEETYPNMSPEQCTLEKRMLSAILHTQTGTSFGQEHLQQLSGAFAAVGKSGQLPLDQLSSRAARSSRFIGDHLRSFFPAEPIATQEHTLTPEKSPELQNFLRGL